MSKTFKRRSPSTRKPMKIFFGLLLFAYLNLGYIPSMLAAEPDLRSAIPPLSDSSQPIYVTNVNDSGWGSLRWAIERANLSPVTDLIDLSQVQGKISLQSSLPEISSSLYLFGDGNDIISGNRAHRVLSITDRFSVGFVT